MKQVQKILESDNFEIIKEGELTLADSLINHYKYPDISENTLANRCNSISSSKYNNNPNHPNNNVSKKNLKEEDFSKTTTILNSYIKTKILISLYVKHKTLKELRKSVNNPSSSIIHSINKLKEEGLVIKSAEYSLTSKGYLITSNLIKLIQNWHLMNYDIDFWLDNDISDIPNNFLKNRHYLKFSEEIVLNPENYSESFYKYSKKIASSKNLKLIVPFFGVEHLNLLTNNINPNCNLELITTPEIWRKIDKQNYYEKLKEKTKGKINIWIIEKIPSLFLTNSEKFFSIGLFPKAKPESSDNSKKKKFKRRKNKRKRNKETLAKDSYDLSRIMISKNQKSIKWGNYLFEEYKRHAVLTYK
ncbi:MAG: helix-turn-helix transcriptional regulator [Methanobacteriaceae archaeon]